MRSSLPRKQKRLGSSQVELDKLAHDLRVQLTTVRAGLGFLNMRLEERLEPEERDLLRSIRASVERLCEMMEAAVALELHIAEEDS